MKQQVNQVKVIQDSINTSGDRMITYEIETYRYIWAEVLTHKMLVKNAQSSRAVPVKSVASVNEHNYVEPIIWGKNKAGMSASEELEGDNLKSARLIWAEMSQTAFSASNMLSDLGLHKMWTNRITEPFSRIKAVISGTEWDNFFWLRTDEEAVQPEFYDLACKMLDARNQSTPFLLRQNELHVPYIERVVETKDGLVHYYSNDKEVSMQDAMKISASCIAQVSYRRLDTSYAKAMEIYDKLFSGPKPHLSPTESIAIALGNNRATLLERVFPSRLAKGVSHIDREGYLWSANLKGFVQYRKLMEEQFKSK